MKKGNMIFLFLLCGLAMFINIGSARESGLLAITNYNSNCNTGLDDVAIADDLIANWYNEIRDDSHGSRAFDDGSRYLVNINFTQNLLADLTEEPYGADSSWIDYVDAAIVACHGYDRDDSFWVGFMRCKNENDECNIWAGGSDDEMEVGDGDNENLVIVSCHSMDKSYFSHWSDWKQMFGGVHVINGYHGNAFAKTFLYDDYQNFADDGFDMPLKTAFIDNLYEIDKLIGDEVCDQCPVTTASGATLLGAIYHRDNFDYYSWGDDPTGNTYWARWGPVGCDPCGEGEY